MKVLNFKIVKTDDKDENPTIGIRELVSLDKNGYERVIERLKDAIEKADKRVFDWREELKNHIRSQKWLEDHRIVTPEDVQTALDVQKVLESEDEEMEVDNAVADYLCEVAESIEWLPSAPVIVLSALLEFKKYFEAVEKDEGTPTPKKKKETAKKAD
jgi:hypothetical protein